MSKPVITFIGAGSTVFTKNIAGDILQRPALAGAEVRLMDINPRAAGGIRNHRRQAGADPGRQGHGQDLSPTSAARWTGADFVVVLLPDRRL